MKISSRTNRRMTSERRSVTNPAARPLPATGSGVPATIGPAIAKSWVVLDRLEGRVDIPEFLPDALHDRAHVGAIPFFAGTGLEPFAAHEIIDLAIRHIAPRLGHQELHDLEFGQGQVELPALPERARAVVVERHARRLGIAGDDRRAALCAGQSELQALQDDRKAARLVDEVDGTAGQSGLFVDRLVVPGE